MAKTIPTTHELIDLAETKAGRPIATGQREEISAMNQQTARNFSASVPISRVALQTPSDNAMINLGSSWSSSTIARGVIRLWGNSARLRLVAYGRNVQVRARIGTDFLGTAVCGGTLGWGSGVITTVTTASISAAGYADVLIEARYKNVSYDLDQVFIEELPVNLADMPTPADPAAGLDYWPIDDDAFAALDPRDVWPLQAIDDNTRAIKYLRARGVLHCFNDLDEYHYLSSINWRCDGPYMINVPPWSDVANVAITARLDALQGDVDVIVYSEHERFDDVQDRLQTISSTTPTTMYFEGIKVTGKQNGSSSNLIWVAFKSQPDNLAPIANVDIGQWGASKPWRLYCEDLLSSYINWPRGIAGVGQADSSTLTGKEGFSFGDIQDYFDIATVEGEEDNVTSSGNNVRQPVLISPHPGTGLTTAPQFVTVQDPGSFSVVSQAVFDVIEIGVARLQGVYIEASISDTARRKLAQPGAPPSASLIAELAGSINSMSRFLTPQILTRHSGNRNNKDINIVGSSTTYAQGHYFFVPVQFSGSAFIPVAYDVPIIGDPNAGAGAGLLVGEVFAQLCYMVVSNNTGVVNSDNLLALYFSEAAGANPGEIVTDYSPIHPIGGMPNATSPTVADATIAAVSGSQIPTISVSKELFENDYSQQYTWTSDTYKTTSPWKLSPVARYDLPASFPTTLELNIENQGGRIGSTDLLTQTVIIVAGLHVWCGVRS